MSVLVDPDILIEVSRGRNTDLVSRWIELGRSDEVRTVLFGGRMGLCGMSPQRLWSGTGRGSSHTVPKFRARTAKANRVKSAWRTFAKPRFGRTFRLVMRRQFRHSEIADLLAKRICRKLSIPDPPG